MESFFVCLLSEDVVKRLKKIPRYIEGKRIIYGLKENDSSHYILWPNRISYVCRRWEKL